MSAESQLWSRVGERDRLNKKFVEWKRVGKKFGKWDRIRNREINAEDGELVKERGACDPPQFRSI